MTNDKKCSCMIHIIVALIVGFLLGALLTYLLKNNDISVSMNTPVTKNKKTHTISEEDEVEGFKNIKRNTQRTKAKDKKNAVFGNKKKKLIWKGTQGKKKKNRCNC